MDELIRNVSTKLGLEESVARQAVGAILLFLKDQVSSTTFDFDTITSQLSGAVQLMNEASEAKAASEQEKTTTAASGQDRTSTTTEEEDTSNTDTDATTTTPKGTSSSLISVFISIVTWMLTVGPILDILKLVVGTVFGDGAVRVITSASEGVDLFQLLQDMGISKDTSQNIISMMVSFFNDKLGSDVMEQLADNVPALKPFLDATKKNE